MNLTRRPNSTQVEILICGQQLEIETWNLGGSREKDTGVEAGSAEMMPESLGVGGIIGSESHGQKRGGPRVKPHATPALEEQEAEPVKNRNHRSKKKI